MKSIAFGVLLLLSVAVVPARAAAVVTQLPPPGLAIADADRQQLEAGVADLGRRIQALQTNLAPSLRVLLPDVEIYHKAVDWALRYNEFFRSNEVGLARNLLKDGQARAAQLEAGQAPWTNAAGLVVRGYRSALDGSVQPYGLIVPAALALNPRFPQRLDIWFHGRDDTLTELKFIAERQTRMGEFAPANTFVLHPYGRYMNAFKFAGEADVFEAMSHVRRSYAIDEQRIAVRGFSMGGAATWHFAAHHGGLWAGAAPGAGFAETAEYLGALKGTNPPPWWEQKLWHLYDSVDYAVNLFNCPTIAYSGELDKQKQAADMMEKAMANEGIKLRHIIGPKVEHKYEPAAKQELAKQFDALMASGRETVPRQVRFATWTLRYNHMEWVVIEGMEEHWRQARVDAQIVETNIIKVVTTNVTAMALVFPVNSTALDPKGPIRILLDGQILLTTSSLTNNSWGARFLKVNGRWQNAGINWMRDNKLRKWHGLQGPIDDAFMESFIFVRPTGPAMNGKTAAWVEAELARAIAQWRAQFRGEVRILDDRDIHIPEVQNNNLIIWGDPTSNRLLVNLLDKLPIQWTAQELAIGGQKFDSSTHVPVLIFPNPLNKRRYVVLNSGFTFRGFGSNADQTPKLPDYAIIDVTQPATTRAPGGVALAGFFDESWALKKP